MNIGIAGTGRMGSAIATRLIGLGHTLTVWNRTPEKTKAAVAAGATVANTPAELASRVLEAFDRAAQAGHGGIDGVRIPAWVSGKGAA